MSVQEYDLQPAIPNKFLNPDGTVSTLQDITGGGGGQANLQSKNVTITENGTRNVFPDEGYDGLSRVNINTTITPNLQSKDVTITQGGVTTITPDNGYDGLNDVDVTVDNTVDSNIQAGNIKKDVTILGITGTYEGSTGQYNAKINTVAQRTRYKLGELISEIPVIDVSRCSDISYMFSGYVSLTSIPLIDTSNITNMSYTFSYDISITSMPLLNTSRVTNMSYTFTGCSSLTSIPLFDTVKVTTFQNAFSACYNLTTVPVLDTSKVTNMTSMFGSCTNLTDNSLDNILQMCINATSYNGIMTLKRLGISDTTAYPVSRIEALPHYQDFITAGWTIGY